MSAAVNSDNLQSVAGYLEEIASAFEKAIPIQATRHISLTCEGRDMLVKELREIGTYLRSVGKALDAKLLACESASTPGCEASPRG